MKRPSRQAKKIPLVCLSAGFEVRIGGGRGASNREERNGLLGPSSAPALGLGVALRHVRLVKMCFKDSHLL